MIGASRRLSDSASEMRKPEPYSSAKTAVSRARIHSGASGEAMSALSTSAVAFGAVSGFGTECGSLGSDTERIASFLP